MRRNHIARHDPRLNLVLKDYVIPAKSRIKIIPFACMKIDLNLISLECVYLSTQGLLPAVRDSF